MRKIAKTEAADMTIMFNKMRLSHLAVELEEFANQMKWLCEVTPTRTTLRQIYAFALMAKANAEGRSIIIAQVREEGEPILAQHLNRSYQLFLDPEEARDMEALDWIKHQYDPADKRRKYLVLTEKGAAIAEQITKWMKRP